MVARVAIHVELESVNEFANSGAKSGVLSPKWLQLLQITVAHPDSPKLQLPVGSRTYVDPSDPYTCTA